MSYVDAVIGGVLSTFGLVMTPSNLVLSVLLEHLDTKGGRRAPSLQLA